VATEYLDIGGIRDRHQQCTLGLWWKDQRFAWSTGNLLYRGVHKLHDATITSTDWVIWKFTHDTDGNVTRIEGPIIGSWDGRALLGWGV